MNRLQIFAQRRLAAATALEALAQRTYAADLGLNPLAGELTATAARARDNRFQVLWIGGFSSGKSTLLNALVGESVLPAKVNPCTAIPTVLAWGDPAHATVHAHNGDNTDLTLAEFAAQFQLDTPDVEAAAAEIADRFAAISRATVYVPLPLLADGVSLFDTPGLDDDPQRTARTLAAIPEADAVVLVLPATRFLSDLDRRVLRAELLARGLPNLFFATTMVDLLDVLTPDPAAARTELIARARQVLGPSCFVDGSDRFSERFFLVDARGALRARYDQRLKQRREPIDADALAKSGLPVFEDALTSFLVHERGEAWLRHLDQLRRRVRDHIAQRPHLDSATAGATAAELERRRDALAPQFAALQATADRVAHIVTGFIRRQQLAVVAELRRFATESERALPDAVATFDLGRLASLAILTDGGRERIEARLREQLEAWLAARVAEGQIQLQQKIGAAIDGLRIELAGEAADFDAHVQGIVVGFGGLDAPQPRLDASDVSTIERWLSIALGAALLSPGTIVSGLADGYSGALRGASSRLGVRVAIVALGALLGPVGWAGLLLYAVSDGLLIALTGGGLSERIREQITTSLRGKLVGQVDAQTETLQLDVAAALAPLNGLAEAARSEADAWRAQLDATIAERERARTADAQRETTYAELLAAFDATDAL